MFAFRLPLVQILILLAVFAKLELAQASDRNVRFRENPCEIHLTLAALERAESPFQSELQKLLQNFTSLQLSIKWNDIGGRSVSLMKADPTSELAIIAPDSQEGASVMTLIKGREVGAEREDTALMNYRILPVNLPDGRTTFNLAIDLNRLRLGRPTNKLNAVGLYAALSTAPYVHYLRIDVTISRTDGPDENLAREAQPELYEEIRKRLGKMRILDIAQELNLVDAQFMKENFPTLGLEKVTISELHPKIDEHDDIYQIALYYKVPSYVKWMADNGSPATKAAIKIMEDRFPKSN